MACFGLAPGKARGHSLEKEDRAATGTRGTLPHAPRMHVTNNLCAPEDSRVLCGYEMRSGHFSLNAARPTTAIIAANVTELRKSRLNSTYKTGNQTNANRFG